MQYFILNLVCTDHGKAKLYGKQVRNNLRESCVSGNQELFFSCPLPKTLWKMKGKHLDFRRYSPHSNKLQMSEEGTYYNKNKTKNKNTGEKKKAHFSGIGRRASRTRGATLPPSGYTGSSRPLPRKPAVRVLSQSSGGSKQTGGFTPRPIPSPPLPSGRESRGAGVAHTEVSP